jgi:hypothetical protein
MSPKIEVKNVAVNVRTSKDDNDYFSLTDMAKWKNKEFPADVVKSWMRTKFTLQFLGIWEEAFNPNFKLVEFDQFKNQAGENGFVMSPEKWIKSTNAIGIRSSAGRYGGTFAHRDIALEFASWLSPEFKLYLIKEFQRLKELERRTVSSLEWQVKRSLVKTNYKIHTDAIKKQLERLNVSKFQEKLRYADEADMLNLIMFGKTAKEWEREHPKLAKQGLNMRDVADIEDLIVLSGLETINAHLLHQGEDKETRVRKLVEEAKKNLESIRNRKSVEEIKRLTRSSVS